MILLIGTASAMPRDALPLDAEEIPRDYRLRIVFHENDGSVQITPGLAVPLAADIPHDIAVEHTQGDEIAVRVWSSGTLVSGPDTHAAPDVPNRPIIEPAEPDGFTAWIQPLARSDHGEIVRAWDRESFLEGRTIYRRDCLVCHGDARNPGTLPTALNFTSGEFKNGADPFSMFLTQKHGFGQMVPQPLLTTYEHYAVIQFIREALVSRHNPGQLTEITDDYIDSLPKGLATAPPEESLRPPDPYKLMDFGPAMFWTYEIDRQNIARKGIAIRLDPGEGGVSKGRAWMIYDHDTLALAAATTGSFIDWRNIAFDGSHGTHVRLTGEKHLTNPISPGWASPDGNWDDPRPIGRDDKPYGPLPREWLRYDGLYHHGDDVIIAATVGGTRVLESPGWIEHQNASIFTRTLEVGECPRPLKLRVAPATVNATLQGEGQLEKQDDFWVATLPGGSRSRILISNADADTLTEAAATAPPPADLSAKTKGGPLRWEAELTTTSEATHTDGPFLAETFPLPIANPWHSWMRPGGFDFTPDGDGAVMATWNGDVWRVDGIKQPAPATLTWRRIATGLFQPLGVKIRDGSIYVLCLDQIARLDDLNGNGEIDFIANFNNDHQVSENFHEFAMGLQTDDAGNFYYAKAARHARDALFPHHGALLKVQADGSRTDIIANGFRAPNGVFLDDDGTLWLTDQEGDWTPKNRINRIVPGKFYGNMQSYTDITDTSDDAMEPPVVWITNRKDRSPAELIRVPHGKWGDLGGTLLNLSYGTGRVFAVPYEEIDGVLQGAVCELPLPAFHTGVMRGRFANDGALYLCGLYAWASNVTSPGGFHRIRHNPDAPAHVPLEVRANPGALTIVLSDPIDPESLTPVSASYRSWQLIRSRRYGSNHHDEMEHPVESLHLAEDGRTLTIRIPTLATTDSYELLLHLQSPEGTPIERSLHGTIHRLSK